ncbi:MAG: polysaccharide biosynthesis C-terminal domain-containing protein [Saprospiraceae bacterium]|nr:polysaccharide biosynthesis C-terminal domain-containing protein [Saprospiraceae bacterium]
MNREFILNVLLLVFINLLIKPFFIFGIDLTVQNRVGEDYGLYFALLNLTYIFQILNDFGIQNFNSRYLSQHPQLLPKYFPNLLAIKFLLGVFYIVLTLFVAWGIFGYGSRELPLLLILLFNAVLVQLTLYLRSNLSGLGHYRLDSLLSSLDKLLMLATCGILLWGNLPGIPLNIETFALAQTLALALTALIVFWVLRQKADFPVRPSWAKNWRAGRPVVLFLLRKSFPYALVILLMFAYTRLDGVLLERLLPDGKAHAEVFAGAYRLLDACNMFGFMFASLLLPMFARLLKNDGTNGARSLASLSFNLLWAGSLTLVTVICFAREDLLRLMMPTRANAYRWDTLGVLIWAFVPVSLTYIFGTLLTAHEKLREMGRVFIFGILLNLVLNLFLIPRYQAFGTALAAVLTQSFVSVGMMWLCAKTFDFWPSQKWWLRKAGFAAFVLAASWFVFEKTDLDWWVKCGIGLLAGAVGAVVFKMADWQRAVAFLKK